MQIGSGKDVSTCLAVLPQEPHHGFDVVGINLTGALALLPTMLASRNGSGLLHV
jgi:hypothetical protein